MRLRLILFAALVLLPGLAASAQTPNGWLIAGSKPASYHARVDGPGTALFASNDAAPVTGFGTLMQSLTADNYRGKRVRFHAMVRPADVVSWASLWMRVDCGDAVCAFDNMRKRPIKGTSVAMPYDVVLQVPKDAKGISFGALVDSSGKIWISDVRLDVVGEDVAVTGGVLLPPPAKSESIPAEPVNLGFAQ